MKAALLMLLMLSACSGEEAIDTRAVRAPETAPVMLFEDGFESGSRSAWSHVDGPASYVTTECRSGLYCGAMAMVGGKDQQSIYWAKQVTHSGETFRASAWWKFPRGFSWDPGGQPWGLEHKMMIINTADGVGRVLLNLRGGGESPEIAVHFERLEPYGDAPGPVSKRSGVRWPADGQWHQFEIEITRRSGMGRAQVWLDGRSVIDEAGRVCGSPCAPIRDLQFGAFSNQGAPRAQTFYLDDALVSSVSRVAVLPPLPVPQPPPLPPALDPAKALEAIARARIELDGARARLDAADAELEASAKALGGALIARTVVR